MTRSIEEPKPGKRVVDEQGVTLVLTEVRRADTSYADHWGCHLCHRNRIVGCYGEKHKFDCGYDTPKTWMTIEDHIRYRMGVKDETPHP